MFTAPTAFRAIRQQDPEGEHIAKYDLDHFRTLFLAGERCDPDTLHWAEEKLGVPVIDHWWQTETGWAIAANCMGVERLPVKAGSPTRPVPGWDLNVLNNEGEPVGPGTIGAIVCKLPLPPGTFPTLWNADERFQQSYLTTFPGYYETGDAGYLDEDGYVFDAGYLDEDGYVFVMARTDDIINVAGHRLSTGAMEEVLASHPDVAECAVIGAADKLKGQLPLGFLVLNAGVDRPQAEDRPGGGVQAGHGGPAPAQDPLGQDPARHHAKDRRRRGLQGPRHHRRSGHPGRDHRRPEDHRLSVGRLKSVR
jgi:propionyl-CoA synthetase